MTLPNTRLSATALESALRILLARRHHESPTTRATTRSLIRQTIHRLRRP